MSEIFLPQSLVCLNLMHESSRFRARFQFSRRRRVALSECTRSTHPTLELAKAKAQCTNILVKMSEKSGKPWAAHNAAYAFSYEWCWS